MGYKTREQLLNELTELRQRVAELEESKLRRGRTEETSLAPGGLYDTTLQSMADAIHVVDRNLRIILFNKKFRQWCEELGFNVEGVGQTVSDVFPFLSENVRDEYERVFRTGQILITEETTRVGDEVYFTETTKIPLVEEANVTGVVTVVRDITERKKAEQRIIESEQLLQGILTASPFGIGKVKNRDIVWVNETLCRQSGYAQDELQGRSVSVFYENDEEHERVGRLLYEEGRAEARMVRKDGTVRNVLIQVSPTDSYSYIFTVLDMTEQKEAAQRLHESEEKFRQIFALENDALFLMDHETGAILEVNDAACAMYGYTREELLYMKASDVSAEPEETERVLKGRQDRIRVRLHKKKGGATFVADISASYFTLKGRLVVLGAVRDITERHKAERELLDSEQRYRSVFDNSLYGIMLTQPDGAILAANRRACEMFQMTEEEIVRAGRAGLIVEDERLHAALAERATRGQWQGELSCRRADGSIFPAELSSNAFLTSDWTEMTSMAIQDITERKRAEEARQKSESRYRALVENVPDVIASFDHDCRYQFINSAISQASKTRPEDFIGRVLGEVEGFTEEQIALRKQVIQNVFQTRTPFEGEFEVQGPNGNLAFEWRVYPVVDAEDNVLSVFSMNRNITERKRAEENLRTSQLQLAEAADLARIVYWEHDEATGEFIFNDAFYELYGTTAEQEGGYRMAREEYIRRFIHPDDREELRRHINEIRTRPRVSNLGQYEHKGVRGDGEVLHILTRNRIVTEPEGRVLKVIGVNQDITDRKSLELRRQLLLRVLEELNGSDDPPDLIRRILLLLKEHTGMDAVALRLQSGNDFPYFEASGFSEEFIETERLLCSPGGDLECLCGKVISGHADPSLTYVTRAGSLWTNDAAGLLASMTEEERGMLRGRCIREGYRSMALVPLRSGGTIVGLLQFNDRLPNRFAPGMIDFLESVGASIGIAFSRKDAVKRLEESEERYRFLFDSISDAVLVHPLTDDGLPGTFTEVNAAARTLLGYSREEFLQMTPADISTPEGRPSIAPMMERLQIEKRTVREGTHVTKDGKRIPVEVSLHAFDFRGKPTVLAAVRDVTERNKHREEIEMLKHSIDVHYDGAYWMDTDNRFVYVNEAACKMLGYGCEELMGMPIHQIIPTLTAQEMGNVWEALRKSGSLVAETVGRREDGSEFPAEIVATYVQFGGSEFACGFARDISEKKKLEEQFRQAQKMEAIGTLAGGVAHDFNNILMVIMGLGNLIQMTVGPDDRLRPLIDQVVLSSERAADLTQSLLAFSRKQRMTLVPHEVNSVVASTAKLLKRLLTEDITLKVDLTHDHAVALLDVSQIDQVLMNLATNARDAMPRGGSLTIATKVVALDETFKKTYGFGRPGTYAQLSVSDTGIGMDEKTMARIFDPFFTTKEIGKGTGLGLASVYGIVKQHEGYITVRSGLLEGTTFDTYLPLVDETVQQPAAASPSLQNGSETILVLEDDRDVRNMMAKIFSDQGYTTLEAANGYDAIRVFEEHKEKIRLVILDVVMPGKNGREVFDEITRIDPQVKAIFMSGYTGDIVVDKGVEKDSVDFLQKPLSVAKLLAKVREVLDR